jgi:hypothetical protein
MEKMMGVEMGWPDGSDISWSSPMPASEVDAYIGKWENMGLEVYDVDEAVV